MAELLKKLKEKMTSEGEYTTITAIMDAYGYDKPEAPRIRLKRAGVKPEGYVFGTKQRPVAAYRLEDVERVFGPMDWKLDGHTFGMKRYPEGKA